MVGKERVSKRVTLLLIDAAINKYDELIETVEAGE